jgi:hypothetical protein
VGILSVDKKQRAVKIQHSLIFTVRKAFTGVNIFAVRC